MEPGGLWWTNVLNSALPPQRHRTDIRPEHQDSVSHMAQKKTEKEKKRKEKKRKERKREIEIEEGTKEGRKKEKFQK